MRRAFSFSQRLFHSSAADHLAGSRMGAGWANSLNVNLLLCSALSLFAAAAVYSSNVAPELFIDLCREDGPIELAQFAAYSFAGGALMHQAMRHRLNPWPWLFGLFFLLIAGEEVSWGQRIFDVATPQELAAVNVQGETNLHNLKWFNGIVRMIGSAIFFGTFVAIPLAQRLSLTNWLVNRLRLPVSPVRYSFAFLLGLGFMIITRVTPDLPYGFDEIGELMFAIAALGLSSEDPILRQAESDS